MSRASGTGDSQSGGNPGLQGNATAGSKLNVTGGGAMNETKQSGLMMGTQYTNSSQKRAAKEDQERQEKAAQAR